MSFVTIGTKDNAFFTRYGGEDRWFAKSDCIFIEYILVIIDNYSYLLQYFYHPSAESVQKSIVQLSQLSRYIRDVMLVLDPYTSFLIPRVHQPKYRSTEFGSSGFAYNIDKLLNCYIGIY